MNFKVVPYQSSYHSLWNEFVAKAKNATFLFHRDFMEYHNDRFDDFSLMVYKEEVLIAVLPANKNEVGVYSHQGLTYGGIVVKNGIRMPDFTAAFRAILIYLNSFGIQELVIKEIPLFYTEQFSDEMKYLAFIMKAEVIRKDICSVIRLDRPFTVSKSVKRDVNNAQRRGLEIEREGDVDVFWENILEPNLMSKFGKKPVHSVEEIQLLKKRFPNNIFQFNVLEDQKVIAGTTVFVTNRVVHAQYISIDHEVEKTGVLDFLYSALMEEYSDDKEYFDFGISNENEGRNINQGLLFWKEKFGAQIVVQEFIKFDCNNYPLLDTIFI
ncbi:GNAT family N-acetyltransferase [Myroides ceti]|uniref:GNAT family N-acetyltransferase n=1 Tax=Paenimyroides ceti TaxID=395087 RepID=A0ABT8CYI4_9FLAO|nr:GNAT family N-acetyltransferase [Paenimyroides ceti]MDN3706406.1 GNAT family N-acetyltransferase [Paenimyroides ceti]MDN3709638.1 GNAT family N-acetyltransferase [Paenimyroides ceti]